MEHDPFVHPQSYNEQANSDDSRIGAEGPLQSGSNEEEQTHFAAESIVEVETPSTKTESLKDPARRYPAKQPTARLRRSGYAALLVLVYATLALYSWIVLIVLTSHPLTTGHYGADFSDMSVYGDIGPSGFQSLYTRNEEYYRAARTINAIVAVLTIPLTSTVCSKAVVAFIQQNSAKGISLRQTMTLADRGWSDPVTYGRLLFGGFRKYGSGFLLGAIALNLLGATIAPLQSASINTNTIKTPASSGMLIQLTDILDRFTGAYARNDSDRNLITVMTRSAIISASSTSPQSRLWTGEAVNCSVAGTIGSNHIGLPLSCVTGGFVSFANLSTLTDPFLAQLPSGYNSGLIRQYLPRINSTADQQYINASEYPSDCDKLPGAFYVHYGSMNPNLLVMTGWGNWSLEVCMPRTQSPWQPTRRRQDFTEELYLNISLKAISPGPFRTAEEQGGLFRLTVNTTAGFFELPNYMNQQRSGPLLDVDPVTICSGDCMYQSVVDAKDFNTTSSKVRRATYDFSNTTNDSLALEMVTNRGALATVALALFGSGSFIPERLANPEAFYSSNSTWYEAPNSGACVSQAPLAGLLREVTGYDQAAYTLGSCVNNLVNDHDGVQNQIVNYIHSFYYNSNSDWGSPYNNIRISNAWTAACFLANDAWLTSTASTTWIVHYDPGADTTIPVMTRRRKLEISILLGIFLTALLGLAIYIAITPRWTDQLDAFALLRLGASIVDDIELRIAHDTSQIKALDTLPGWIGDATDGEGGIGELRLGASRALRRRQEYAAYHAVN